MVTLSHGQLPVQDTEQFLNLIIMTNKYAILNPLNGQYSLVDTKDELAATMANLAMDVYVNHHCHGNPYSLVTIDDATENEIWTTADGSPQLSPSELQAAAETAAKKRFIPQTTL
jgi:hypothetical protein